MALTIKQFGLNDSFLLTFEPLCGTIWEPFRILLDPVLAGPSESTLRSDSSSTLKGHQVCVSSLRGLPEPNLVIISQNRGSHLHEDTLRQLAPGNTKTLILAEPSAAKTIRSWNYFDEGVVRTLYPWEDGRPRGRDTATRLAVSPCYLGGDPGEVTVSLIPQKKDTKGMHSAIGITYRPPPAQPNVFRRTMLSPPITPTSPISAMPPQLPPSVTMDPAKLPFTARIVPPTPPDSPLLTHPLRSVRSLASGSPHTYERALSVIFSPHGTSYSSLEAYATSHLVCEAALPLTALLHSFNSQPSPWWFLGNAAAGTPVGQETALALAAHAWMGTHNQHQVATEGRRSRQQRKMYTADEVRESLRQAEAKERKTSPRRKFPKPTVLLDLELGEEVTLTSEGVLEVQPQEMLEKTMVPDALGVFHNFPIVV